MLFLSTLPAMAQNDSLLIETGNDMVEGFKACDLERGAPVSEHTMLIAKCVHVKGFVEGVAMATEGISAVLRATPSAGLLVEILGVNMPEGVTNGQIDAVVRHFLDNHPETLHTSASVLVQRALREAWPNKA